MSDDCLSTLADVQEFDGICDCPPLCMDEPEGFSAKISTDLIDLSSSMDNTNPSTTTTTMFNKTVAAALRSLITDISVDVHTTKVIKD